jgi:hypothetical protein
MTAGGGGQPGMLTDDGFNELDGPSVYERGKATVRPLRRFKTRASMLA